MTTTKTTKAPIYLSFAAALKAKCAEMGLTPETADTDTGFPNNKGYFWITFGDARMYVPKSADRMANLHLHIDCSDLEGHVPLPKENGKVLGHFVPDIGLLAPVLTRLVGASKRPTQRPSGTTQRATPAATFADDVFGPSLEAAIASERARQALEDGEAELRAMELATSPGRQ